MSANNTRKRKLSSYVVDEIINRIQRKELRVGDKLPSERTLASETGVSRTVIREALQTLKEQELISYEDGSYKVCPMAVSPILGRIMREFMVDSQKGWELFEIREMFEEYTVRRAAERASPESIQKLQSAVDEMDRVAHGLVKYNWNYELAFHTEIIHAAGNAVIEYIYDLCGDVLNAPSKTASRTATPEDLERGTKEHQAIVDAIKAHDGEVAARCMRYHLESANKVVSRIWDQEDSNNEKDT